MPYVAPLHESQQYDGTNGAALAQWIGADGFTEANSRLVLTVTVYGLTYDVGLDVGWWLIRSSGVCGGAHSPEDYPRYWHELPA